jgi:molecular chaperone DnaK (HSP70)
MDLEFLRECEEQKKMLSKVQSMPCNELLPSTDGSFITAQRTITRQELNTLIESLIDKTINKTRLIIDDVKAQKLPLDSIILIGGSSRIPLVTEKLKALVGPDVEIRSTGLVDVAVALGALYSLNVPIKDSTAPEPPAAPKPTKHFCTDCGKEVWSNQKFCIHCGHPNYSYKA